MGENKNLFLPQTAPGGTSGQGVETNAGAEETKALESDNNTVASGTSFLMQLLPFLTLARLKRRMAVLHHPEWSEGGYDAQTT